MLSPGKNNREKEEIIEKIICEKYNSYYRMAYSYVNNEADASDIVQESAYKAIKNSSKLKNTDYASTWIYRIVMNEIFRFTGAKKIIPMEETELALGQTEDTYENLDLKRAMEAMEPKDRAVVQLRYFEERKLEEISQILGENLSTVKSRLYRGLKKLRLEMEA